MRIWIDLANSPHVPFFRALANEFERRSHEIIVTARDFAETVELAKAAGFNAEVIGGHGGANLSGKAGNLIQRALKLARWARSQRPDLAVSHNSYSQVLAARALSLKTVTLMDYEHQPANHLAFRLATRLIVPDAFPDAALVRFGANPSKVRKYGGTKEDVYLANFHVNPDFEVKLREMGIDRDDILVTVRPPASEALYHRFTNELFDRLVDRLLSIAGVKIVMLPRNESQRAMYTSREKANLVVPPNALDGPNLIANSDLVVSAGGTMNREAAALGVPVASIYAGEWAAIDEQLIAEGRLQKISSPQDIETLAIRKKGPLKVRAATHLANEVANLILDD
ncbi:MAG TPA: DUF354 domain-containing protein [Pyrinomonadaceae bacterium]|nr:DUF354 domain-containing protein [Pyrinomonadaceae bacterium]